jgi:hypothetical protein
MWYVFSCILLFDMGMHESLEEILVEAKWKWELEWNISSFRRSNTFTFQFGLVWSLRMCWKFFPCSSLKSFWSGLFSFGDVNNVPRRLVKFHLGFIIIWRIWNECILVAVDYFMGRRIKHYWLMMNLTRHFKIWSGMFFFLNCLGDICCQRTMCNCWTWLAMITIVLNGNKNKMFDVDWLCLTSNAIFGS